MGNKILLLFFVFVVLGRLSIGVDLLFSYYDIDIPTRLLTKVLWMVIYLVPLGYVFYLAIYDRSVVIGKLKHNKYLIVSLFLIVASTLLSAVTAYDPSQAWFGVVYYAVLVSIPVLMLLIIDIRKFYSQFLSVLFIVNVFLIVVAFLQILGFSYGGSENAFIKIFDLGGFMPISFFTISTGTGESFLRPSSLLVDPNIAAGFYAISAVFFLDYMFRKERVKFSLLGFATSVVSILLTVSRTGLISLVIGIIVYLLFKRIFEMKRFNISANAFIPVLLSRLSLKDGSALEHLEYAKSAFEAFKTSPLFGIGIGSFGKFYGDKIGVGTTLANPHSAFLRILAEMGVLGAVVFANLIGFLAYSALRSRFALSLALLACILAGNLFYDYLMTPWVWFIIGLVVIMNNEKMVLRQAS